jgi:hypothetical protein
MNSTPKHQKLYDIIRVVLVIFIVNALILSFNLEHHIDRIKALSIGIMISISIMLYIHKKNKF